MTTLREKLGLRRFITKALTANWGAHSGQTILGNLKRGPGGRFGSSGGPSTPQADRLAEQARANVRSEVKKPAAKRGGGGRKKAPAKVKATPEQAKAAREAEKDAARDKNRAEIFTQLKLDGDAQAGLLKLAAGNQPDHDVGGLVDSGLAEIDKSGQYRLTPAGSRLLKAADRGDAAEAATIMSETTDAQLAAKEPAGGGGGGGGKKELSDAEKKEQASQAKLQVAAETAAKVGLPDNAAEVLAAAAEGRPANVPDGSYDESANALLALGLTTEGDATEATDAGRRALAALLRGDLSGYQAAVQDAKEKAQRLADRETAQADREQASARSDLESAIGQEERAREAEAKKLASDAAKTLKRQAQEQVQAERQAKLDRARADRDAERKSNAAARAAKAAEAERRRRLNRREKSLGPMVFKDAQGNWRWLQTSTTAYRDRHGETVTKSAMAADCDYADRTGEYGPLLWWHTKFPLGDCDFNAVSGPVLIESGTFRKPEYALAVQREASNLGVSIGFIPWPGEPKSDGLYTFIRRKERSVLPIEEAANPFTRLVVYKENKMDPTRLAQLAKLLNISEADAAQVVENEVARVSKAAGAQGLVAKAAGKPPFAAAGAADEEPADTGDAEGPALDMAAGEDVEAGLADGGTGGADLDPLAGQDDMGGNLFTPQEMQEIAGAIAPVVAAQVVEALMPQLNLEDRMRKMADEIKNLVAPKAPPPPAGGNVVTKEAEPKETEVELKIKSLEKELAELRGDQPAGAGYRPSVAGDPLMASVIRSLMEGRDLKVKGLGLAGAPATSSDPLDSIVDSILPGSSPAA